MNEEKQQEELRPKVAIERVQLGVRMEKNMVKVLKALAEFKNMTLGEFFESIILHSFTPIPGQEGEQACSPVSKEDLKALQQFKKIYGVEWDSHSYMQFEESSSFNARRGINLHKERNNKFLRLYEICK